MNKKITTMRNFIIVLILTIIFVGCNSSNNNPRPVPPPPEFELIPDSSGPAATGLGKLEVVTYKRAGNYYSKLGGVQVTLFTEQAFVNDLPALTTGVTDAAGFIDLGYYNPGNYVVLFEYNISKDSVYSYYKSTQINAYLIRRLHEVVIME